MPLVVLVGIPSCGKSTRASEIKNKIGSQVSERVHVVSENEIMKAKGYTKNDLFNDSQKEKEVRGILKSESIRLLTTKNLVILDAGNYIKGFRYELYCASKNSKSTQITLECLVSLEDSWEWNTQRPEEERYSRECFDALLQRYEPPDKRNRWDSPLISLQKDDELPEQMIGDYLFHRKPPPPNQSTQNPALVPAEFLYELDKVTQEVISAILLSQSLGGSQLILGCEFIPPSQPLTAIQLARYRRQFLNYTRHHPPSQSDRADSIAQLFVQFLNTSVKPL